VATVLARRRRKIVLFEPSGYNQRRIGETLGPEVQALLASLGLGEHKALPLVPFCGVRSAWGGPELVERPSINHPLGEGWHVDRARFDEELARGAAEAGAHVHASCGRCSLKRTLQGFGVRSAKGQAASARYLVDASGRGAPASSAALSEGRWLQFDRLVALMGRIRLCELQVPAPELLLEAEEHGWWYSAPQPDGTLLVAFMTDSDLAPARGRIGLTERWETALARTTHTRERVGRGQLLGPIRPVRADSGLLLPDRGSQWRAVGDAAMAFDPLAGNGVARALRMAIAAAGEIDRVLDNADPCVWGVSADFAKYLDQRDRYYRVEGRWPSAPFWVRRRPPDWTQSALTLAPTATLFWDGRKRSPAELACVESLLPYRVITKILDLLRTPRSAADALLKLRDLAPIGDRRLLVALQLLVGCSTIVTAEAENC
jgi:flavin-dependent dehydrogenase